MSTLTGQQLKDQGIERIQKRKWHDVAFAALNTAMSRSGHWPEAIWPDEFSISFLKGGLVNLPPAPHPNCWGALINAAAKAGLVERVGYRPSLEPSAHRRIVSVWRRK